MSTDEFGGRAPLGIGTVRGARAFRVDSLGRLLPATGAGRGYKWRPGENVAECGARYGKHSLSDCECGFYAYYEGSNDYGSKPNMISAMIEGYGEVVIGTRGFRAKKAKIVALVKPRRPGWHTRLAAFIWDHDLEPFALLVFVLAIVGSITSVASTVGLWGHLQPWQSVVCLATAGFLHVGTAGLRAMNWVDSDQRAAVTADIRFDRVRKNYPNVKIYRSFREMAKAMPPDAGAEPSPETDPHFWD